MNHERFEDLKDAFVLGALPESERREFEEYLIEHPERQAEIDDLSTVAGLLALSPDEQEPPPELRRSIMDLVEAEAGRPRVESWSWLARMQEFLGVRGLALGAAAAMLVIGLFSWNMILQSEIRDMQGQIQSRQSAQDSQTVALEGSGAARGAQAELVVLEGDQAVLVAEDMPPPPEGKTFQIWVIEGDVPKPSGLFEPDKDRVAAVVEKPLEGADAVAVTVEPEGGSAKPTTEPMLTAKL